MEQRPLAFYFSLIYVLNFFSYTFLFFRIRSLLCERQERANLFPSKRRKNKKQENNPLDLTALHNSYLMH